MACRHISIQAASKEHFYIARGSTLIALRANYILLFLSPILITQCRVSSQLATTFIVTPKKQNILPKQP